MKVGDRVTVLFCGSSERGQLKRLSSKSATVVIDEVHDGPGKGWVKVTPRQVRVKLDQIQEK